MSRFPPGSLLDESGLSRFVMPLSDRHFVVAPGAALPVWIALGPGVSGSLYRPAGLIAWLAFVLWQPLIEELVFRGILQGQLLRIFGGRPVARLREFARALRQRLAGRRDACDLQRGLRDRRAGCRLSVARAP